MLIWLMSLLYALPRRARQHDKRVAFAVTPALCLSAFFLPRKPGPPRPSTWPDRHVSRGHEARPETDDMRHPVYQIGTISGAHTRQRASSGKKQSHIPSLMPVGRRRARSADMHVQRADTAFN